MSNLTKRIVSGIVGIGLIVGLILIGKWGYLFLFGVISIFTLYEFYTALHGWDRYLGYYIMFIGFIVFLLGFFIESSAISPSYYLLIFPLVFSIFIIKLYQPSSEPFVQIAGTLFGFIYILVPFMLLHRISFQGGAYSYKLPLGLLFLIWASDTGAYFVGKYFGRNKLFERISPGKTWEGTLGGVALTLLVAWGLNYWFGNPQTNLWWALGLVVSILGPFGDLVESMFKRSVHVKDSGKLIPGHGGFLDRFDSFLLIVPVATFIVEVWI